MITSRPNAPCKTARELSNKIRSAARKSAFAAPVPRVCVECGYVKHVEVCHIKPICSFPVGTELTEINADSNLTYLCPTHHWEFDHGVLKRTPPSLEEIMMRRTMSDAAYRRRRKKLTSRA